MWGAVNENSPGGGREEEEDSLLTSYACTNPSPPGRSSNEQGMWSSRNSLSVTGARILTAMGSLVMFVVIAWAISATTGSFGEQITWLLSNPWGVVSLVDLYVGFTVFSMWIWFREGSKVAAAAWTVAMMTTGWLGGSVYVFICLRQFKGDWQWFFMGNRRP